VWPRRVGDRHCLVAVEWLQLVGDRQIRRPRPAGLHLSLLGDLQCIVNLDAETPDDAFELCVSKQKLNGTEIPRAPVDQRIFGASQ
jgi:hypothetical protein